MDVLGIFHLAVSVVALVAAGVVIALPKGRPTHRRVGWTYVVSMLFLNVSALLIYDLFGRFGPFHIAAIVSLITVVAGTIPVLRRMPKKTWVAHHATWMVWSCVGLYAAAASEISTRWLHVSFWGAVLAATLAVLLAGAIAIRRRLPGTLEPFLRTTRVQ